MNWRTQISGFALVGIVATGLQYVLMAVMIHGFDWQALPAGALAYVGSAVFNYLLSRRFVFRSQARHAVAGLRFAVIVVVGLGLNSMLLHLGTVWLEWHWLPAQGVSTALVMFNNFLLAKFWAFDRCRRIQGVDE
ncbi:MAG: hypothetical protein C0423_19325 [Methylibium sp.]|nr:hypothetical protein [Methylibium sp.]